ncbi:hypothetical protein LCGC14_2161060 [marine sediment metagenome]|uniref:Uncharacterized protein n=1 Tax=marine sediment metagenome TaxID=412755 RepID=A0A0F9DSN2_9ZZZZ
MAEGYITARPFLYYRQTPFTLHSGKSSHWFVSGEAIFNDPYLKEEVLDCWTKALPDTYKVPHFFGIPSGGTPWAEAIAEYTYGIVLTDPTSLTPETYLVDDVTTTGQSFRAYGSTLPRLVVVNRGDVPVLSSWLSLSLA